MLINVAFSYNNDCHLYRITDTCLGIYTIQISNRVTAPSARFLIAFISHYKSHGRSVVPNLVKYFQQMNYSINQIKLMFERMSELGNVHDQHYYLKVLTQMRRLA